MVTKREVCERERKRIDEGTWQMERKKGETDVVGTDEKKGENQKEDYEKAVYSAVVVGGLAYSHLVYYMVCEEYEGCEQHQTQRRRRKRWGYSGGLEDRTHEEGFDEAWKRKG